LEKNFSPKILEIFGEKGGARSSSRGHRTQLRTNASYK